LRLGEELTTPQCKIVNRINNIEMTCLVMILWEDVNTENIDIRFCT